MPLISFCLPDLEQTKSMASCFAACLSQMSEYPVFLLQGELGAGKTTFIRELVTRFPGGSESEICSPSFNLVNYYPTTPRVSHFDLYRLDHCGIDPDLEEELLDAESRLILVEWGNFLPHDLQPETSVRLTFNICPLGRDLTIEGEQEDLLSCINSRALQSGIPVQEERKCR